MAKKRKYQSSKEQSKNLKPIIYVVCEGTTERQYFKELAKLYQKEVTFNFKAKVASDTESALGKLIELMTKYLEEHEDLELGDKVFIIFDRDSKSNRAKHFEQAEKWQKENERHMLILSNPCFEYWLLLHYEKCSVSNSKDAVNKLAKHINGYSSKSKSLDGWKLTEALINTAMENSAQRECSGRLSKSKEVLCCTNMRGAIEVIRSMAGK